LSQSCPLNTGLTVLVVISRVYDNKHLQIRLSCKEYRQIIVLALLYYCLF